MEVRVLFWAPSFPLSKLFDQLKNAARTREEKSPGLLLEALQKSQQGIVAPAQADAQSAQPVAPAQAGAQSPRSYSGIALAILIFVVAVLAWHSQPWRAPQKLKIDPSELKLDRTLDLHRLPSEGTSPPGRPS